MSVPARPEVRPLEGATGLRAPERVRDRDAVSEAVAGRIRDREAPSLAFGVFAARASRLWLRAQPKPSRKLRGFGCFEGLPDRTLHKPLAFRYVMLQDGSVRPSPIAVLVTVAAISAAAHAGKPRWQTLPRPPAMPRADAEGTVEVAGARIYYGIYGRGAPVVLLHGGLGNAEHFGFQLPALIDRFQVIAIDSRGQGRSTKGKAPITYDQMEADVIAVLDQLEIQRASVVGWSDGGEIALKLGIAFPDRVDRLFVFGANYDANGSKPRSTPSATFAVYTSRCRSDYQRLSRSGLPYNALIEALRPLWRNPTGITRDQLRGIKAPVMMADGDHDEVIALEQIEEMAKLIPNAQLKVFEATSHFALWQDPGSFNRAMVEFLTAPAPETAAAPAPAPAARAPGLDPDRRSAAPRSGAAGQR